MYTITIPESKRMQYIYDRFCSTSTFIMLRCKKGFAQKTAKMIRDSGSIFEKCGCIYSTPVLNTFCPFDFISRVPICLG